MESMSQRTVLCTLAMDPAGVAIVAPVAAISVAPDTSPETLRRVVVDADILVVRNQLPADIFEQPNHLLGVVRHGVGLDMIPVESASAHGIPVANVPGANSQAVVEYCIGSFLLLARRFDAMDRALRSKGWNEARAISNAAVELAGKTAGIVGLGNIGASLARACKNGLGMRVLGYQPARELIPDFVEAVDLDTLIETSDFISLNCPLTPETRHLVNERRLRAMKPGAVLVNASRGAVVDEAALARALAQKWIAGAALDVYSEQPLRSDHPLLALENVLLTPHAASLTRESSATMSIGTARQVVQLLEGRRPDHLVNPEVWDRYTKRRAELAVSGAEGVL
jgi:D-3-phosphoglycerate dehydrogenase / 2-oxoglutarate reductase